ncbi:MAG: hypothetical protein IT487_13715 [Chromatiaceae bacterium]|nr:hypothetical protein [Chromatiaceae bacterium]
MTETMLTTLLGHLTTLLVATGGWVFAYLMQRDAKLRARLEGKLTRLEDEVRARIALEKAACVWLSELTEKTHHAAKLELRKRAQDRSGLRPKLAESDLSASRVTD